MNCRWKFPVDKRWLPFDPLHAGVGAQVSQEYVKRPLRGGELRLDHLRQQALRVGELGEISKFIPQESLAR